MDTLFSHLTQAQGMALGALALLAAVMMYRAGKERSQDNKDSEQYSVRRSTKTSHGLTSR